MKSRTKKVSIYYIGYVTIKNSKYAKIDGVNPLYLIINKVIGYFEEINKSKYLIASIAFLLMRAKKK